MTEVFPSLFPSPSLLCIDDKFSSESSFKWLAEPSASARPLYYSFTSDTVDPRFLPKKKQPDVLKMKSTQVQTVKYTRTCHTRTRAAFLEALTALMTWCWMTLPRMSRCLTMMTSSLIALCTSFFSGVAWISRLLTIIGLFCKRAL